MAQRLAPQAVDEDYNFRDSVVVESGRVEVAGRCRFCYRSVSASLSSTMSGTAAAMTILCSRLSRPPVGGEVMAAATSKHFLRHY
jgi:hypothetical protein